MTIELNLPVDMVNTVLKALEMSNQSMALAHEEIREQAKTQLQDAVEEAENAGGTD